MKKPRSFIIACGGTGGHLSPGIALAQRLTKLGYHCTLLTSRKKIDSQLSEKYTDLEFRPAPGVALGKSPIALAKFFWNLCHSVLFGLSLFIRRRPAAFISFGGFLTAGLTIAAKMLFIPIVLHEANRVPGKSVRLMSHFANRVYLPPGVRLSGFVTRFVTRSAGFPVREEMQPLDKIASRKKLGLPENGKLLMIFGGSQGASALNKWVREHAADLLKSNISLMCVTGPKNIDETASVPEKIAGTDAVAKFIPFCNDMAAALSAADLVISRAGAGSCAEFVACCVPAILVPYPFAADNHQLANAQFFIEKGAGLLIEEKDVPAQLLAETQKVILDDLLLEQFRKNIKRMSREFDWSNIIADLVNFAEKNKNSLKSEQA